MIVALDVHYSATRANAAAVLVDRWTSGDPIAEFSAIESPVGDYEAGRFYMRELSPLLAVLRKIDHPVDAYVIDGYCHLSSDRAPGLGAYLSEAIHHTAPVIGVAKSRYRQTQHAVEVLRGQSRRPLFVTSIGMDYEVAARHIASMAGDYRVPEILKSVDRLARAGLESRGY